MIFFHNFDQISEFFQIFKLFYQILEFYQISIFFTKLFLTKFQNFDQVSEFWPNFRILTKFQNFDQISEFQPNFRILTNFQIFYQISSFSPNFIIFTKFKNFLSQEPVWNRREELDQPLWGKEASQEGGERPQLQPLPLRTVLFLFKPSRKTFENTQWRKDKQMQPVWFCILSGRRFEETFENTQWRQIKQM